MHVYSSLPARYSSRVTTHKSASQRRDTNKKTVSVLPLSGLCVVTPNVFVSADDRDAREGRLVDGTANRDWFGDNKQPVVYIVVIIIIIVFLY